MTTNEDGEVKQSGLQIIPNEIIENIGRFFLPEDLDDFRNFRLSCRNVLPVATRLYAQHRFNKLCISTKKANVEEAIEIFRGPEMGKSVKHVTLFFNGSHAAGDRLKAAEWELKKMRRRIKWRIQHGDNDYMDSDEDDDTAELAILEATVLDARIEYQATLEEDPDQLDVASLLKHFPNMTTLVLWTLNQTNRKAKLPWANFTAQVYANKVTSLELSSCEIASSDIDHLLSTFPGLMKLSISGRYGFVDGCAPSCCQILLHGHSLKCLFIDIAAHPAHECFLPEGVETESSREFQKEHRTYDNFVLKKHNAQANGQLAVKFVCEKIVKFLVGEEEYGLMMERVKREARDDVVSESGGASI